MALSAFYIHRRTVDHVLHRLVEIRRAPPAAVDGEDGTDCEDDDMSEFDPDGGESEADSNVRNYPGTLSRSVDDTTNLLRNYRISSSMPNVVSATDWFPRSRASSHDNLKSVPLGLPSLRMRATNGITSKPKHVLVSFCIIFFTIDMFFWLKL